MLQNITSLLEDQSMEPRLLEWMAFMANDVEFWPFGGVVHQQSHWSRVLLLAMNIAHHEGLSNADVEALAMASAFHDTRRLTAFPDKGHGNRAAEYYSSFCKATGLEFDPRTYLAIKWHDQDDADGEAAIREWMRANSMQDGWQASALDIFKIFKDSDNLDRLRIADRALNMDFIRLPYSKTLRGFSKDLLEKSQAVGTRESDPVERRRWLVVVDVQNDFTAGSLGTPEAQAALDAMVAKARGFDGTVVFTKDTHSPAYLNTSEGKQLPVEHCIAPGEGWQLVPQMQQVCDERGSSVYMKGTFGSTRLAADLAAACARGNLESVEFIGLCTDICVISNALEVKAQNPEIPIYVDPSCCAGTTPERHDAALLAMRSCQIGVS